MNGFLENFFIYMQGIQTKEQLEGNDILTEVSLFISVLFCGRVVARRNENK